MYKNRRHIHVPWLIILRYLYLTRFSKRYSIANKELRQKTKCAPFRNAIYFPAYF